MLLSDMHDCGVRIHTVILQNICSFSGGCVWSVFVEGVAFAKLKKYLQVICEVVVPAGCVLLLLMAAYCELQGDRLGPGNSTDIPSHFLMY